MSLNIGIERKTSGRKEEDQGDMEDKINEENKKSLSQKQNKRKMSGSKGENRSKREKGKETQRR